jgi:hypothetical protein
MGKRVNRMVSPSGGLAAKALPYQGHVALNLKIKTLQCFAQVIQTGLTGWGVEQAVFRALAPTQ